MGTHPIFESDFDCLTEMDNNEDKELEALRDAVEEPIETTNGEPQEEQMMMTSLEKDEMKSDSEENRGNTESNPSSPQEEIQNQIKPDDPHSPITEVSTTEDIGEEMSEAQKRVSESPVSVAASDSSSTRPNKRKRKGTAPTRHVQPAEGSSSQNGEPKPTNNGTENEDNETEDNSDSEFDKAYNEIDKANNRKLLEEFETKSEIVSRPDSISEPIGLAATQSRPQKYGPPRLDLFGPPQHYLDLFGPPVRESTDNCSVAIRGIGEEEIYCGPGDKDPGDTMIPLRTH